jgi:hypothetical protein
MELVLSAMTTTLWRTSTQFVRTLISKRRRRGSFWHEQGFAKREKHVILTVRNGKITTMVIAIMILDLMKVTL